MQITGVRLAYVPFKTDEKYIPGTHVYVIFETDTGKEIAISPEADTPIGTYSPMKGMRKTYRLVYTVAQPVFFEDRYRKLRRSVHEYSLDLPQRTVQRLYDAMITRSAQLQEQPEWYHTFAHSCTTVLIDHLVALQVLHPGPARRFLLSVSPRGLLKFTNASRT